MEATKKKYIRTVGRRKTATASVKITPANKQAVSINGKALTEYFATAELQGIVLAPVVETKLDQVFDISITAQGGGIHSQAEAIRHGLARELTEYDETMRGTLKKLGMLKRDPRMKERRKFGLKKARKAPQWSKR